MTVTWHFTEMVIHHPLFQYLLTVDVRYRRCRLNMRKDNVRLCGLWRTVNVGSHSVFYRQMDSKLISSEHIFNSEVVVMGLGTHSAILYVYVVQLRLLFISGDLRILCEFDWIKCSLSGYILYVYMYIVLTVSCFLNRKLFVFNVDIMLYSIFNLPRGSNIYESIE